MVRMPDGGRQGRRFRTTDPIKVCLGLGCGMWLRHIVAPPPTPPPAALALLVVLSNAYCV